MRLKPALCGLALLLLVSLSCSFADVSDDEIAEALSLILTELETASSEQEKISAELEKAQNRQSDITTTLERVENERLPAISEHVTSLQASFETYRANKTREDRLQWIAVALAWVIAAIAIAT